MTYRLIVWREAGNYGPLGGYQPQKNLGEFHPPRLPHVGDVLTIKGEDYSVVSTDVGFCHVRPMRMDLR